MTKRTVNIFTIFILGLFFTLSAVFEIIEELNFDLRKATTVTGRVRYADTRQIKNFTIRWTTYKRVFYFRLDNSNERFVIERSDEAYGNYVRNINVGDTVKVYYNSSTREYNKHVFQVEKARGIVASYSDYSTMVSSKFGILLFIGLLLTIGSVMWYKRFNLVRFMTELVNDKGRRR